ncbi:MAG: class I SAM-dependent methyltransferase [Turicibacter sp.]|nr:class I SAM-dependent methyltransferase [Turicibacter sp.]
MLITTSLDEAPLLVDQAKSLATAMNIDYTPRNRRTIGALLKTASPHLFVVNAHRGLNYYNGDEHGVFFHPNMAFLRIKQLERGQKDSFVTACGLEAGMRVFDATIGLASDALVAAYAIGPTGRVFGAERSRPVYWLTTQGLKTYSQSHPDWSGLIGRIQVENKNNLELLKTLPDNSMDVVYFDFMFEKNVSTSHGIQVIHSIAAKDLITPEHVAQAKRVARIRVVAKSGYSGNSLEELGFSVLKKHKRRNFYFGIIE